MTRNDKKEDIELTAEEGVKLKQAFEDEAFRKLMAEYVSEISDPKHKEEQEAYIAQLEAQNEVPTGKALVWPSSGFVVKCTHKKIRDDNVGKSKLFLNIVYSERVAEPTVNKSEHDGSNWSVPYAIGPLRMENDKSGRTLVPTFDCCFHPLSLKYAHGSNTGGKKPFLDLIVNIAKEAVGVAFEKAGDEVEIHTGYTILRGVSYKSGTPKVLLVGCGDRNDDVKEDTTSSRESSRAKAKEATPIISTMGQAVSLVKNGKSCDDTKPRVPKYKIVEQGVFDIAEHTTKTHAPMPRKPRQLVVHIYVDKAASAAHVNLDVSEQELVIKADSNCKYSLELQLPYRVDSQKGNARFDTKQRTLIVTLPVVA
ncbi:hypothetical protein ACHAXR_004137 [Thalassiosira sp. AJA248-18]